MRVIPSPSTEISINSLSVEEAAAALVALVVSRARTPAQQEIANGKRRTTSHEEVRS